MNQIANDGFHREAIRFGVDGFEHHQIDTGFVVMIRGWPIVCVAFDLSQDFCDELVDLWQMLVATRLHISEGGNRSTPAPPAKTA